MVVVVGVRFKKAGKVYYFSPDGLVLNLHDRVVVETVRGIELGWLVATARDVDEAEVVTPLKSVIRLASLDDLEKWQQNKLREEEAFNIAQKKIVEHKLPMKLVDVEFTFDVNRIIFYFTAEGRVDFRELVRDLAAVFRTRIELRQIGVRDEAKMMGGIGSCGRELCCASFLGEFEPVSIRMAKDQNLSLNPGKISGICGRLMCCLKFESETYEDAKKRQPSCNKKCGNVALAQEDQVVGLDSHTPDIALLEEQETSIDEQIKPSPKQKHKKTSRRGNNG